MLSEILIRGILKLESLPEDLHLGILYPENMHPPQPGLSLRTFSLEVRSPR